MIKITFKIQNLIMISSRILIWIWMLINLKSCHQMKRIRQNLKKLPHFHLCKKQPPLFQLKMFLLLKVKWKQRISKKNKLFKFMSEQSFTLKECSHTDVLASRKYLSNCTEFQKMQNQKQKNFNSLIIHILQIKMDLVTY